MKQSILFFCALVLTHVCGMLNSAQAQSIDLTVSPPMLTVVRGEVAEFDCSVTANAFTQQVFLEVDSTDFDASFGTYEFQPIFINAPYTDTATFRVSTLGTMSPGTYSFILRAGNGNVIDTDTISLKVEADSCSWVLSNPPDLGTDEALVGLGNDGDSVLWIAAKTRLITFDSLNWDSSPYPNGAEANAAPIVDDLNRVLVPSTQGLLIWDGNAWDSLTESNSSLPHNFVGSVVQAPNNDLYIGTRAGLAIYDGNFWSVYDTSFTDLPYNNIRDLVYIDSQSVWGITYPFGSEPFLMVEFTGNDFTVADNRLIDVGFTPCDDTAHSALSLDDQNNLWVATRAGAVKLKPEELEWEKWKRSTNSPNHFIHDNDCNLLLADDSSQLGGSVISYLFADEQDVWIMRACRNLHS